MLNFRFLQDHLQDLLVVQWEKKIGICGSEGEAGLQSVEVESPAWQRPELRRVRSEWGPPKGRHERERKAKDESLGPSSCEEEEETEDHQEQWKENQEALMP